ncbi:MAG TPA: alpha/beta hydrolase, partial [Actinomycetaceae bacterium]|nr:alpha/beta hydrolase [Actinomycetaceae bacterium]
GNIGGWAVRHDYVAVAINYVLAPESQWPGGARDISRAISWIVEHIADFGGDPRQIVLVGQSAGAMHVADYLTRPEVYGAHGRALAGAALISCLYNVGRTADKPMHRAYWGEDLAAWAGMGSLDGLIDSDLPLFLAVAEHDDLEFQDQAAELVATWQARRGQYPPMHYLAGHNHLSTVYGIGTDVDTLGPLLAQYISGLGAAPTAGAAS